MAKAPKPLATKSKRFADYPTDPPPSGCQHFNCGRTKNLWPWESDSDVLWFCWPHYRRYRDRPNPYRGRLKHHDFATSRLERPDYPPDERAKHREFAKRILSGHHLGGTWFDDYHGFGARKEYA